MGMVEVTIRDHTRFTASGFGAESKAVVTLTSGCRHELYGVANLTHLECYRRGTELVINVR